MELKVVEGQRQPFWGDGTEERPEGQGGTSQERKGIAV